MATVSEQALPALVTQLVQDGATLARAEVRLAKAKIGAKVAAIKVSAIFLAAAAVIALLGLIGLVVGCVLALAPLVGGGFAGLIVLGIALVIAGILAWIGTSRLSADPVAAVEAAA